MVQVSVHTLILATVLMLTKSAMATLEDKGTLMSLEQQEKMESGQRSRICPLGCLSCSKWNGCIACASEFAWHLEKAFMRAIGVCLRECPAGYLKQPFQHAPEYFTCTECEPANCAVCSNTDFCDKCQEPYLEYRGTCRLECPQNLYHSTYRRDCFEQVDCLTHSWSIWSECLRDGHSCGYKWGNRTRSRVILQQPSPNGNSCPPTTESQRCKLKERYCKSVQFSLLGPVTRQRHERQKQKRKLRCRQLRRSGRRCKSENNYIEKVVTSAPENSNSLNISSYYDYYRQSAELLQLLNLKKTIRLERGRRDKKRMGHIDPG